MPMEALHLYTDDVLLQAALKAPQAEPVASAVAFLRAAPGDIIRQRPTPTRRDRHKVEPVVRPALSSSEQMMADAFAFRFLNDESAGARATAALFEARHSHRDAVSLVDAARDWLSAAHTADLLHTQPHFQRDAAGWWDAAAQQQARLAAHEAANSEETSWQALTALVRGLRFGEDALYQAAAQRLRSVVDQIHPEGYLRSLVTSDDPQDNYRRMVSGVGALVLAAEAARRADDALWRYDNRGVSIGTAVAYLVSFYFYPQKWRWGGALEEAFVAQQAAQAAFLEIAAHRAPLRATAILVHDLRPFFSLHYGGLTTLTYGAAPQPEQKKRRFFWS